MHRWRVAISLGLGGGNFSALTSSANNCLSTPALALSRAFIDAVMSACILLFNVTVTDEVGEEVKNRRKNIV